MAVPVELAAVGIDAGVAEGEGVGADVQGEVAGDAAGDGGECEDKRVGAGREGDQEILDGEGGSREIEGVVGERAVVVRRVVPDADDHGACSELPYGEGGGPDLGLGGGVRGGGE